jgi:hypothetical protein
MFMIFDYVMLYVYGTINRALRISSTIYLLRFLQFLHITTNLNCQKRIC